MAREDYYRNKDLDEYRMSSSDYGSDWGSRSPRGGSDDRSDERNFRDRWPMSSSSGGSSHWDVADQDRGQGQGSFGYGGYGWSGGTGSYRGGYGSNQPTGGYSGEYGERYRGSTSRYGFGSERDYRDPYRDRDRDRDRSQGEGLGQKIKRFFGIAPKGYSRSDERIREEICETIMREGNFDPSDVEVKVEESVVTLDGTVLTRSDKYEVERIADGVMGVKDINNNLRVDSSRSIGQGQGNVTSIASGTESGPGSSSSRRSSRSS